MTENKLFEAVADLVLQSISVWEDMHLYAMTYSEEYNAFWGLLDENLKTAVCRCRKQNREERLVPFTMSRFKYYKVLLKKESFEGIGGQYWKKQIKLIMADSKFRAVMSRLNLELMSRHKGAFRNLEHRSDAAAGSRQFATRVG